ncbi:MAG TPA: DegV family protein [Aggregatilineales bacterium]|nr:DegV family protein [Aggregatilineales bacterium]
MKIGLVTDGTCDLPGDIAAANAICIVPHHVIWGTQVYTDGVNLSREAFYERLARDPVLPSTAQPSAIEFVEAYRDVRNRSGADAILCLTTSRHITGAYDSALLASSMVEFPVRVLDSNTATVTLGLTVLAVADALKHEISLDDAQQVAWRAAVNSRFYFTLDTLDYLHRGGRIGRAQHLIGNVLNLKPILTIEDGSVAPLERTRSRHQAIARLKEIAATYADRDMARPLRLAVVHSNAAELEELSNALCDLLTPEQFFQTLACSPVGVYAGPNSIGFGLVFGT